MCYAQHLALYSSSTSAISNHPHVIYLHSFLLIPYNNKSKKDDLIILGKELDEALVKPS